MGREPPFTRDELAGAREALIRVPRPVRFQDVDAAGTIFFPRVFEYAADAYGDLLARGGVDLPRLLAEGRWAAPLVHAEADYLAPLRFGDAVVVEVVAVRMGTTAFTLGHRIRAAAAPGRLHALVQTVHVCIDAQSFLPVPVPEMIRRALTAPTPAGGD